MFEQCLLVIYVTVVIPFKFGVGYLAHDFYAVVSNYFRFSGIHCQVRSSLRPCQPPTMHCTKESCQLRSLESQTVSLSSRMQWIVVLETDLHPQWFCDIIKGVSDWELTSGHPTGHLLEKRHLLYKLFPLFRSHAILWWAMLLGAHGYYPGLSPSCSRSIESAVPNFIWFSLRLENCSRMCTANTNRMLSFRFTL